MANRQSSTALCSSLFSFTARAVSVSMRCSSGVSRRRLPPLLEIGLRDETGRLRAFFGLVRAVGFRAGLGEGALGEILAAWRMGRIQIRRAHDQGVCSLSRAQGQSAGCFGYPRNLRTD